MAPRPEEDAYLCKGSRYCLVIRAEIPLTELRLDVFPYFLVQRRHLTDTPTEKDMPGAMRQAAAEGFISDAREGRQTGFEGRQATVVLLVSPQSGPAQHCDGLLRPAER
jgi:hypothetical protein